MSDLRLGIVGIGRIGQMHVENINKLVNGLKVTAIADIAADQHKDWISKQGITEVYTDYKEMIEKSQLDAVLIAASTTLHHDICIAAADAKLHVFCEKPIELDISRAQAMIDACKNAGVKLQVGFNRRFDHNFKKVRDIVESGKIGDPHLVRIASRDPAPPPAEYVKISGGIFLDMMIHDFDMIRYLSGSDVEEIYAIGNVLIDPAIGEAGDVDTAIVTMKMANGALAVIDNSRQAVYGYDQRVEVFGSKGQALANNDKPTTVEVSTAETEESDKIPYFFLDRYTQAFVDEFNGFVSCINNNTSPLVDGTDGLRAVQVAMAAGQSLKEGRPIKIQY